METIFISRLSKLDPAVPVTALYGGDSWVTTIAQEDFEAVRIKKIEILVHLLGFLSLFEEIDAIHESEESIHL